MIPHCDELAAIPSQLALNSKPIGVSIGNCQTQNVGPHPFTHRSPTFTFETSADFSLTPTALVPRVRNLSTRLSRQACRPGTAARTRHFQFRRKVWLFVDNLTSRVTVIHISASAPDRAWQRGWRDKALQADSRLSRTRWPRRSAMVAKSKRLQQEADAGADRFRCPR